MSLGLFLMAASGLEVFLQNFSVSAPDFGSGATANFRVDNDGNIYGDNISTGTFEWLVAGAPGDVELRFTRGDELAGTWNVGTFETWLAASTDRTFGFTGPQFSSGNGTLELRDAVGGTVLATATVSASIT